METLFLIYEQTLEEEIERIIERDMVVSRFTRVDDVIGARVATREENRGRLARRRNRLIMIIAEKPTIARLVEHLRALRSREGHGLRAFVVQATTVI